MADLCTVDRLCGPLEQHAESIAQPERYLNRVSPAGHRPETARNRHAKKE
jgi:hypothetical protein